MPVLGHDSFRGAKGTDWFVRWLLRLHVWRLLRSSKLLLLIVGIGTAAVLTHLILRFMGLKGNGLVSVG
jgi:hypothetical protein